MPQDMKTKLGRALLKGLIDLREAKGELSLADVGAMFMTMASSFNPPMSTADHYMSEINFPSRRTPHDRARSQDAH